MSSPQRTEPEKTAYFQLLSSLNGTAADHDDDLGEWEQRDRQRRRRFFASRPPGDIPSVGTGEDAPASDHGQDDVSESGHGRPSAARVIANTQSGGHGARKRRLDVLLSTEPGNVDETVVPDSTRPAHTLRRSDSTPMPTKKLFPGGGDPSPSLGAGLRKRKRNSDSKLRPEAEQIFKNLVFFYIPDNDIAPARRLRIAKAREYGALWTKSLSTATHIVVDKNLDYQDVEKFASAASRTRPPKLVNEDYPIDCIQFRSLLDPNQKKYQIPSQPIATADAQPEAAATRSQRLGSFQVKPRHNDQGRRSDAPPSSIPLRDDTFSHGSHVEATPAPTGQQPTTLAQSQNPEEVSARDELAGVMTMMHRFKHLPLDNDDDEDARSEPGQSGAESSAEDRSDDKRGLDTDELPPGQVGKGRSHEHGLACHRAGEKDAYADNPNARTISVLQEMASYYERVNDHWRTTGYRKAIATLKRQDVKIHSEEEAFRLPNIGRRIAQKIEEIATTDRLRRLEYAGDEATDGVLELFLQIYGVGSSQARQWIARGYRTLEDVARQAKLTASQRIGIEHYEDLAMPIPRREVEALGAMVRQAAARVDPGVELIIGGSYRRGAASSHDVDLIVTKCGSEHLSELRPLLDSLVEQLEKDEFLVARLASSRRGGGGGSTWHGCCVLPAASAAGQRQGVWRRIDFLLVPGTELGAALLYFTGDDLFNRSMRLLARNRGMRLNQRGLWRGAALVEGRDERRIFEALGVRWREPHERWC